MNDYPVEAQTVGSALGGFNVPKGANPTMRENIEAKIQYHKDEIVRLENIKEKLPQLLDVNLRDLREAMNY